ncbi:MAG TPA: hypothetical protein ENJ95_15305 [Bacteroidetes bacterium]|nr:hypothetical protein [Bacteroidota bacterium]
MLEIIVGMIFTYMVLSLLGTTINELISSWRGWRGLYLEEGLKRLLKFESDSSIFKKFTDNEFYKQLKQHKTPLRMSRAPEYLSAENFVSILTNTLKKKGVPVDKVEDMIEGLPADSKLREVLEQFKEEGHQSVEAYKQRLGNWFDDVMSHTSGWYKRHLQFVTIFVGLGIAMVFNADSFSIYSHLTKNTAARESLSTLARTFAENNDALPELKNYADTLAYEDIKKEIQNFTNSGEFAQVSNILGLGWQEGDLLIGPMDWLVRILGWLITALAISLGAPFWFSALKRIISINSSGGSSNNAPQVVINTGDKKKEV